MKKKLIKLLSLIIFIQIVSLIVITTICIVNNTYPFIIPYSVMIQTIGLNIITAVFVYEITEYGIDGGDTIGFLATSTIFVTFVCLVLLCVPIVEADNKLLQFYILLYVLCSIGFPSFIIYLYSKTKQLVEIKNKYKNIKNESSKYLVTTYKNLKKLSKFEIKNVNYNLSCDLIKSIKNLVYEIETSSNLIDYSKQKELKHIIELKLIENESAIGTFSTIINRNLNDDKMLERQLQTINEMKPKLLNLFSDLTNEIKEIRKEIERTFLNELEIDREIELKNEIKFL